MEPPIVFHIISRIFISIAEGEGERGRGGGEVGACVCVHTHAYLRNFFSRCDNGSMSLENALSVSDDGSMSDCWPNNAMTHRTQ